MLYILFGLVWVEIFYKAEDIKISINAIIYINLWALNQAA